VPEGLGDGGLQVLEIDRFGHEIKSAAVHGGADVAHVAIGIDLVGQRREIATLFTDITVSPRLRRRWNPASSDRCSMNTSRA
jgi:hypothetical protein